MSTTSREELLDQAIDWLVNRVNTILIEADASHGKSSGQNEVQPSTNRTLRDRMALRRRLDDPPPPPARRELQLIDKQRARRFAYKKLESRYSEFDEQYETVLVVEAICAAFHEPRASSLAIAWLADGDFDEEVIMNLDTDTLAILIGVAAAAAIFAVVWVVRRGRSVQLRVHTEFKPSDDFANLRRVAESSVSGADVAARIVAEAKEPWNWLLVPAISALPDTEKHRLLEGFVAIGIGDVRVVRPAAGETFNASTMTPMSGITDDDCWVVAGEPPEGQVGFTVTGRIVMTAHVEVCTVDWWVLSKSDCPVGRAVADGSNDLIAGGRTGAVRWRASWGFRHPEDLRLRFGFDERTLDKWRTRMATEINMYYEGRPDRCLAIPGLAGDIFETSTMEDSNGQPIGDAVVVEIMKRDGVPQHGLACPGGNPLLLAVVNTKPVNRTTP